MVMEYIEIGSTPYDEDCAQVGANGYREEAMKEMDAYINQLNRHFTIAITYGIKFKQKWFNHDFGSYGEVCMYWNNENEDANTIAYEIESNLPGKWDKEALIELSTSNV
jgi:hypothetical protein